MSVFILGDSHAAGISSTVHGRSLSSFYRIGWSTARYSNEPDWDEAIREAAPDTVVVILGANDAAQSRSAYENQVRAVVSRIRGTGVRRVIWVSPPITSKPSLDLRQNRIFMWQREIMPKIGVTLISGKELTADLSPLLREDGVHFLSDGYERWASRLLNAVLSSLEVARGKLSWGMVVPVGITALVVYLFWKTLNVRR